MNNQNNLEFLEWQQQLLKPQIVSAVEDMMEELEYSPPPPDPLRSPVSEKVATANLKEQMTVFLLEQNPSEKILIGFDLIFNHLQEVENGIASLEEMKNAGALIAEQFQPLLDSDEDLGDFALSLDLSSDTESPLYGTLGISYETFQAMYHLGNQFFEKKDFGKALCVFKVLNLLDNQCPEAWFAAGLCQCHLESWQHAIIDFMMASAAEPTNILAYTNMAQCYLKNHQRDKAIEMIDLAETMINAPECDLTLKGNYIATMQDLRRQAA